MRSISSVAAALPSMLEGLSLAARRCRPQNTRGAGSSSYRSSVEKPRLLLAEQEVVRRVEIVDDLFRRFFVLFEKASTNYRSTRRVRDLSVPRLDLSRSVPAPFKFVVLYFLSICHVPRLYRSLRLSSLLGQYRLSSDRGARSSRSFRSSPERHRRRRVGQPACATAFRELSIARRRESTPSDERDRSPCRSRSQEQLARRLDSRPPSNRRPPSRPSTAVTARFAYTPSHRANLSAMRKRTNNYRYSTYLKKSLKEPNFTMAQIAWLLSYERSEFFTHAFRCWAGRPPSQVRSASHEPSAGAKMQNFGA